MSYATEAGVKRRCGIESDSEEHDTEIGEAQAYGDAFVGGKLTEFGISGDTSNTALIAAANDFAAFWWYRNHGNTESAVSFFETANTLVLGYCIGTVGYVARTGGPPYRPPHLDRG